jgi:hypothetical protein
MIGIEGVKTKKQRVMTHEKGDCLGEYKVKLPSEGETKRRIRGLGE